MTETSRGPSKAIANDKLERAMHALRSIDVDVVNAADDHVVDEFIELVRFYLSDREDADAEWKAWYEDYARRVREIV
jgi:hypothetical protein